MSRPPIDEIDQAIIHLLQQDARRSNTDIAKHVIVSATTVRNRIERLEEEGIINGYSINVDYDQAGAPLHYQFSCTSKVGDREELTRKTLTIPGVVESRELMTGEQNVQIEAIGIDVHDITRVALAIEELGLDINKELLIRYELHQALGQFEFNFDTPTE